MSQIDHRLFRLNKYLCVICGIRPATTRDHTPPKGVFPSPRPTDLITVPACVECNQGSSDLDEYFRAYLSLHVGIGTPITEALWIDRALPRIQRRPKLKEEIIARTEPILIPSSHNSLELGYRTLWNSSAHDAVIERTIRGLYFHHFHEILGNRVHIRTHWFRGLNPALLDESRDWSQSSIGMGQFTYRFVRAEDGPLYSAWLFQFHQKHWAGGHTTPLEEAIA